jgi:Enoyl-(Acyl carrier protein) reductase
MGGYAATKAGLAMLTQSLAVDHAHEGLRAHVVCPGWTITEMADEEMAAFSAERGVGVPAAYELVTALVPQRRPAHAGEVAAVVAWLLSDAASYVNGAVIPVDGSASAVDVGTLAFDPRVGVRLERGRRESLASADPCRPDRMAGWRHTGGFGAMISRTDANTRMTAPTPISPIRAARTRKWPLMPTRNSTVAR